MAPRGHEVLKHSAGATSSGASSFRRIIGIDPGASGGIARISYDQAGQVIAGSLAFKMPATERDIWDALSALTGSAELAVIEHVHSMPRQGVASMFTFGKGYGGLRMALVGQGIPFLEVAPQRWTKALGLPAGADKNSHKAMAQQLFPGERITHATADALLIALWGARFYIPSGGKEVARVQGDGVLHQRLR